MLNHQAAGPNHMESPGNLLQQQNFDVQVSWNKSYRTVCCFHGPQSDIFIVGSQPKIWVMWVGGMGVGKSTVCWSHSGCLIFHIRRMRLLRPLVAISASLAQNWVPMHHSPFLDLPSDILRSAHLVACNLFRNKTEIGFISYKIAFKLVLLCASGCQTSLWLGSLTFLRLQWALDKGKRMTNFWFGNLIIKCLVLFSY